MTRVATLLIAATLGAPASTAAQSADAAVRSAAERFLEVLGLGELEKLPPLLAPGATVVVARMRDGRWTHTTQTFEQRLAAQKAQATPSRFREPLTDVTIHVEDGQLAFLRAHFTIVIDGAIQSHGVDYFTFVNIDGAWRVANLSYTNVAGPPR